MAAVLRATLQSCDLRGVLCFCNDGEAVQRKGERLCLKQRKARAPEKMSGPMIGEQFLDASLNIVSNPIQSLSHSAVILEES